jgi:hypothetical protein
MINIFLTKNIIFLYCGGTINVSGSSAPDRRGFFVPPVPGVITPIWRADRAEYNSFRANKPSQLTLVVETRRLIQAAILKRQEVQMSIENQTQQQSVIFPYEDICLNCDRLENARAIIGFLAAAACGILEREEPISSNEIFGLFLTHQWAQEMIESVENYLRHTEVQS